MRERSTHSDASADPGMKPVPLWRRYDRLLGPDPAASLKDELHFHLEAKVDDLVAQGWSPEATRKQAERRLGDILAVRHVGERRSFWGSLAYGQKMGRGIVFRLLRR